MNDQAKSPQQLLAELECLRGRVSELEEVCKEAQKVESSLRQSHDELHAIYEGMVDGLLIADIETKRFVRANASICRMLGYSEPELLSMSVRDIHPPEELPDVLRKFQAQVAGSIVLSENRVVRRKDGSVFYADVFAKRITCHGRPCLVGVFRDISKRRQAEEALRQSEACLAERTRLAEWRATQLQRLAADLTQAEERERRRLARVLHDHLQQILVAAKLALAGIEKKWQDAAAPLSFERIRSLLDDALGESRSLTTELSPPVLYDRGLVAGLQWLGRQMGEKLHLTVSVQADPAAEPLDDTIKVFVFQAAREFVLNAAKHGRATSLTLTLSKLDDEQIRLMVADDGVGCDPNRLHDRSETGGFGLFSIRERLDLIGGRLELTSAPGEGTTATLIAPNKGLRRAVVLKSTSVAPRQARSPEASLPSGERIRVLLADDHPILRKGLAEMLLEQPGLDLVGEAGNGQQALEMALQLHPHVVLMDVSMPRMDGIEATRRIKEVAPEIRIIGLSMHQRDDMESTMRNAGASGYLVKTAAAEELIGAILNQAPPLI